MQGNVLCKLKFIFFLFRMGKRSEQNEHTSVCPMQYLCIYRRVRYSLYVGLAHAVPPTNTKFKPLLLLTQTGCRTQTLTSTEHHISSLHLHFWVQPSSGSAFPQPDKNQKFLRFFIINIVITESVVALSM